jgi:hypothetical protein
MKAMHKLGSLLFLYFAIMCPAQVTSGSSTAASPSGTPPAQAAKTPGNTHAEKTQKKTPAQGKKKAGEKKAEEHPKTEEQQKAEAKKAADEQADRVGGGVTPAVLSHHRTCGSAYGGS